MESKDPATEGYQRLAAAIIIQAYVDLKKRKNSNGYFRNLCESSRKTAMQRQEDELLNFFFGPHPTVDSLIDVAGLGVDPSAIRRRALQILNKKTRLKDI